MITILMSAFLIMSPYAEVDSYTVLERSANRLAVMQGSQTFKLTLDAETDSKTWRFEEQGSYLEVCYFGIDQVRAIELRSNLSGEPVSHQFMFREGELLATEEAWDYVALLEPQGESLFSDWQAISEKEIAPSAVEAEIGSSERALEDRPCRGLYAVGIGFGRSEAKADLNFNCHNRACFNCCRHFGCNKISFFVWRCTGRACDRDLDLILP